MKGVIGSWWKGAFILIALFLALSMSGGLARSISAGGQFTTGTIKALQGRG